jgi:hypothetical protein
MENEEKLMTGEESLRIITEMINKTKTSISQSSFHLLFWGWLIFFCSLSEFILYRFTDFSNSWYVWFLVIPGVFVSMIYGFVKGRREKAHTYTEIIYMWTWLGLAFAIAVLCVVQGKEMASVDKYILVLVGLPTFISGFILKFKPLIIGGITFWIFALIANFSGPDISSLCMPVAIVTGYLVPGYLLKRKDCHGSI